MEGGIHYPYPHSPQALPQGPPAEYKGWANYCLLDRGACSHQIQVGEKASSSTPSIISTNTDIQTHSTVSGLDAEMRPVLIRGHGQGAGISHPESFSPPV